VAGYLANCEGDPVRLEHIAARLAALQPLTRKYGATVDEVLDWAEEAVARLTGLEDSDERVAALEVELAGLDAELTILADQLSHLRHAAADRLAAAVDRELTALALPQARLRFDVARLGELGPTGRDSVQILFSAQGDAPPQPLSKVASGGELSRVRLALEVVLAGVDEPTTLVFDEVDAGIGGATGVEVGRRLARLARWHQVIVVTHLAQVAAFADRHFVVARPSDGPVTTTTVRLLGDDERPAELARMMGGLEDSASAQEAARELRALALAAETEPEPEDDDYDEEPESARGRAPREQPPARGRAALYWIITFLIILAVAGAGAALFESGVFSKKPAASSSSSSEISDSSAPSSSSAVSIAPAGPPAPNFVGQTWAQLTASSPTPQGYQIQIAGKQYSSTVPRGIILSQDPAAGAPSPVDEPIKLIISLGPSQVAVPDVTGLSWAEAEIKLLQVGFLPGNIIKMDKYDATRKPGAVLSTLPAAGTKLNPDAVVTVFVNSYTGSSSSGGH